MNGKKDCIHNININSILSLHFIYKCSKSIRQRYSLNTHAITVLVGCYLYYTYIDRIFNITNIVKLLNVYSYTKVKRYVLLLDSIRLITLVGSNKYTLTDTGLSAIAEISNNANGLIYSFCSKYGIEL